jgi:hypothetical protein
VLVGSNKSIIGRGGSENHPSYALAVLLLTGHRNRRHWPLGYKCDQRHHPQHSA